jgi:hypothetical protein
MPASPSRVPNRPAPTSSSPSSAGAARIADIDGDGDLDVVFTQIAGPPLLLRNDQSLGNHFVRLKLVGTTANRDALGASVKLIVNGQPQWREVMSGNAT